MLASSRRWTVVALLFNLFMGALEATVVSTAMPTVIGDLGGIDLYSWVFTAYLVASTVTVPIWGKLADQSGRKPIALLGTGIFVLGSLGSGAARSMSELIAARIVQGIGAGATGPMALTIVGDLYPVEKRGRVQALFGSVWGIAGLVGPIVGGLVVKHFSWRWVFAFNVPAGIVSMVILWLAFHEEVLGRPRNLDVLGALLLSLVVVALLGAAHGGTEGILLGVLCFPLRALLFWVERRAKEPILPLELLGRRPIWVASVASALAGGAMFASVTYIPLLVQAVQGGTPTEAGTAIAPMLIGWPIAGAITGRLVMRIGFRPLIRFGMSLLVVSLGLIALTVEAGGAMWALRVATGILGLGLGFANTALIIAVQTAVPWNERGVATANSLFSRTIGGSLLVGLEGAFLSQTLRQSGVPPSAADALLGPSHGAELAHEVRTALISRLGHGLGVAFWVTAGVGALALFTALAFPVVSLRPGAVETTSP